MEDDEILLCNTCSDLVGLQTMELFPLRLLQTKQAGEWIGVREFCVHIGVDAGAATLNLFAAWLPDPTGADAYAVIVFYDDETQWSMAAHYHRARLLKRFQATESASTGASASGVVVGQSAAASQP